MIVSINVGCFKGNFFATFFEDLLKVITREVFESEPKRTNKRPRTKPGIKTIEYRLDVTDHFHNRPFKCIFYLCIHKCMCLFCQHVDPGKPIETYKTILYCYIIFEFSA